jgi:hypothetical protein
MKVHAGFFIRGAGGPRTGTSRGYWYATYTGKSESGWSANRLPVIMCEYEVEGRRFWKTFKTARCPKTVEVEEKGAATG